MAETRYLTLAEVLELHADVMQRTGSEPQPPRTLDGLSSALQPSRDGRLTTLAPIWSGRLPTWPLGSVALRRSWMGTSERDSSPLSSS